MTKVINWLNALFSTIAQGIRAALPYWQVFEDTVRAVWNGIVDVAMVAWNDFKTLFAGFAQSLKDAGLTWDNFKQGFLVTMFTIQFAVQNFTKVWTDLLPASMNVFAEFAQSFFASLSENFKAFFENMAQNVVKNIMAVWEGIAHLEKPKLDWTPLPDWKKMDQGWKKSLDKMKDTLKDSGLLDFVKKKMDEFNNPKIGQDDVDKAKSNLLNSAKNPATALAGSQEAFHIIAGDQGDKMYNAVNDSLKENKKMRAALDKMEQMMAFGKVILNPSRL